MEKVISTQIYSSEKFLQENGLLQEGQEGTLVVSMPESLRQIGANVALEHIGPKKIYTGNTPEYLSAGDVILRLSASNNEVLTRAMAAFSDELSQADPHTEQVTVSTTPNKLQSLATSLLGFVGIRL